MGFFTDNEDLTIFLAGEFSQVATVLDSGSTIAELSGIFDEESSPMFDMTTPSEGRRIEFLVKTADAVDLAHGDRIEIGGKTYEIVGIDPRDDGRITDLILKRSFA
ncbi:MAG: hypothetical protein QNJ53_14675 [Pleurocapsa sp. MO_192.B19]|nr:hypothetical protein [Pleurocapsa sp. MO_192.B19]